MDRNRNRSLVYKPRSFLFLSFLSFAFAFSFRFVLFFPREKLFWCMLRTSYRILTVEADGVFDAEDVIPLKACFASCPVQCFERVGSREDVVWKNAKARSCHRRPRRILLLFVRLNVSSESDHEDVT